MKKQEIRFKDKVVNVLGVILSIFLILVLLINCTLIMKSIIHKEEIPHIGGIYPLIVLSDSMNPEFYSGDMIICQHLNPDDIKVGDVISYYDERTLKPMLVTHRVIEISHDDSRLYFKTKGDANNMADIADVRGESVIGIYKLRIPYYGHLALFMQSKCGFITCACMPIFILVFFQMRKRNEETQK